MPSAISASLLDASAQIGRIFDDGFNALLTIGKDSVWVSWDGCVPWESEAGEELPGVIGLFRRVGKPYEYERGEVQVRGHDTFIIMRTKDVLNGKLKAQAIVTVASRENPAEPPTKYKVRMVDEMGDTNAHVYLLDLGQPDPDVEPEPEPPRRHRPRNEDDDGLGLSPSERRKLSRWR